MLVYLSCIYMTVLFYFKFNPFYRNLCNYIYIRFIVKKTVGIGYVLLLEIP